MCAMRDGDMVRQPASSCDCCFASPQLKERADDGLIVITSAGPVKGRPSIVISLMKQLGFVL